MDLWSIQIPSISYSVPKLPTLPPAFLRFCQQTIDLSKIYVSNDAVLLLAVRHHQHVVRSGQINHEQWSLMPDNVVDQYCRPDKVLTSSTTDQTSGSRRDSPRSVKDPNDSTVPCLNSRKYGDCRFTGYKCRYEKTTRLGAGGPQASKIRQSTTATPPSANIYSSPIGPQSIQAP